MSSLPHASTSAPARPRLQQPPAEIRALITCAVWRILKQSPRADVFRDSVNPEVVHRLEHAAPLDWIPFSDHTHLIHATASVFESDQEFVALWKQFVNEAMSQPLLRLSFQGLAKLGAVGPNLVIKGMPLFWDLISRNAGRIRVDPLQGGNAFRFRFCDAPTVFMAAECVRCFAITYEAMFRLAGVPNVDAVGQAEELKREVWIQVQWAS